MKIDDKINMDGFMMKCVFKTIFNDKEYVVLHPLDAPDDIQFVPMRLLNDNDLIPEYSSVVCERIIALYKEFKRDKE